MKDKILITGANGFVGCNLVLNLDLKKYDVYLVDIVNKNQLKSVLKNIKYVKYIKTNLANKAQVKKIGKYNFKYIFHFASIIGVNKVNDSYETINSIINMTVNVINYLVKKNTVFIFSSTSEVYGNNLKLPWSENHEMHLGNTDSRRWNYAKCKSLMENLILDESKKINFKYIILRFFNLYGPYQSENFVVPKFIKNSIKNKNCKINYPYNQFRCFTYIDDVVNFFLKIIRLKKVKSGIYNIGNNKPTKVIDLAKKIIHISNSKSKVVKNKNYYLRIHFKDVIKRKPDITKIYKHYKWKPTTSLLSGLHSTLKWFRANL
jgi:UDP-glucose 4-epimerase